jgi:hypothetical protein
MKFSALKNIMSSHPGDDYIAGGDHRTDPMLTFLLQSSIFIVGFALGYAACAWRSRQHRTRHSTFKSRNTGPHTSTFGHARRAF